ncbi:PRC-barrel domain-containing protein [Streptacidiphilus rugosus]|uniref:PRC-barrel domain-containing protein n=1 Tax=Streptacidiphilus rugosus TaxID=405783 RepID=UPI000568C823|nr:PRC-barrel domain-containing protein [Streptacidiphilus rugosus]
MNTGIWAFRENSGHQLGTDLTGFEVEAVDGRIGKVDQHDADTDQGCLVVDTGGWILGRQVLLPVGTIASIDRPGGVIRVARTREEIRNAPEYDPDKHGDDPEYRQQVGAYYLMLPWT